MKRLISIIGIIAILSGLLAPFIPIGAIKIAVASSYETITVNSTIAAANDDCQVQWVPGSSNWTYDGAATSIRAGYNSPSWYAAGGGMRYQVNVPQGATIISASINSICSLASGYTVVNTVFHTEASDNASAFSNLANYQARRGTDVDGADNTSLSKTSVKWSSIPAWSLNTTYTSPDLTTIIQEVVSRPGWVQNNYAVIFWDDHLNESSQTTGCTRSAATYDNTTYDPPILSITYTTEARTGITHISANSTTHDDYGLSYPVTYRFLLPASSSNLTAYKRYSESDNWTAISEKESTDFFNGIEAARFDYNNNQAYISVAFSGDTDDIYLTVTDNESNTVDTIYLDIPLYYDNRHAVVVASLDDWKDVYADNFTALINEFQSRYMWVTPGIITSSTNGTTWASIQAEINEGYVEVAAHSRTHPHTPYVDNEGEIEGCKQDITSNLTLPSNYTSGANKYVWCWIQPYGNSDANTRTQCATSHYLADRDFPAVTWGYEEYLNADYYVDWDDTYGIWDEIPISRIIDNDAGPNSTVNITTLNAHFDTVYAAEGIYHIMGHPYNITAGDSYVQDHLDYVSGKTDVWYVGLGAAYLYHFIDTQNVLTITMFAEDATPDAPTNFSATDGTNVASVNLTWTQSDNATGYYLYRDDVLIQTLGTVDHYEDTNATSGNITAGAAGATNGTSNDYVTLSISGESTANGTTHTYKISAYNDDGASDNATDTGYRGVGSLSIQWLRSAAASDSDFSNITGATTDPYNDTAAPESGGTRYYYAALTASGAASVNTTHDSGFRGAPPVLASIGNRSVTVNTTLQFTISATGIGTIQYGVTGNPAGSSINGTTGVFSWTPSATGTFTAVSFNATNEYGSDSENITITVNAASGSFIIDTFPGLREVLTIFPTIWFIGIPILLGLESFYLYSGFNTHGGKYAVTAKGLMTIVITVLTVIIGIAGMVPLLNALWEIISA